MKLAVVVALIVGCGSSKSEPAKPESTKPDVEASPTPGDSPVAIQAAGFNEEGVKAMYGGNYALASEHFRNAVARMPEPRYFFNLCTSLFQEGKFAEAKRSCAAVDNNAPTPALAEKAQKLSAKIDAEAKSQGISLDRADPQPESSPPASGGQAAIAAKLSDEGVKLMYANKYADASAKFRDAVARVPEPKYFFNLCTALYQEGKFSEALIACGAVSKSNPTPQLQAKANSMIDRIQGEAKAQNINLTP